MRTMDAFWDRRALKYIHYRCGLQRPAPFSWPIVAGQMLVRSRAGAILAIAALAALSLTMLTAA